MITRGLYMQSMWTDLEHTSDSLTEHRRGTARRSSLSNHSQHVHERVNASRVQLPIATRRHTQVCLSVCLSLFCNIIRWLVIQPMVLFRYYSLGRCRAGYTLCFVSHFRSCENVVTRLRALQAVTSLIRLSACVDQVT